MDTDNYRGDSGDRNSRQHVLFLGLNGPSRILGDRGHLGIILLNWSFPGVSDGKESACNVGDPGSIPGSGRPLEKGMATHSSILAWRMLWTEEPGWSQSMGHKESDTTEQLTLTHNR